MFFIRREGQYVPLHLPFRVYMRDGFTAADGTRHQATRGDWDLHLSTLFPEIRLKPYLEVRGCDSVSSQFLCAMPALWKGILYDEEATAAAWELVAGTSNSRSARRCGSSAASTRCARRGCMRCP
jgi:glutamate--cysteine ligase